MDEIKVREILREALWRAYCSGRANNEYIPEEVLPDLMKRCQLFIAPTLEDDELGEPAPGAIERIMKAIGVKTTPGRLLTKEEIPYGTDVHLDAGVYDGLYRKKFIEGAEAQLAKDIEWEALQKGVVVASEKHFTPPDAEQELREKIARKVRDWRFGATKNGALFPFEQESEFVHKECYFIVDWFTKEALPELAKEAGYFQEEAEWLGKLVDEGWIPPEKAKKYVQLVYNPDYLDFQKGVETTKELFKGYKELAKDQSYLNSGFDSFRAFKKAIRAGWRKVILCPQ